MTWPSGKWGSFLLLTWPNCSVFVSLWKAFAIPMKWVQEKYLHLIPGIWRLWMRLTKPGLDRIYKAGKLIIYLVASQASSRWIRNKPWFRMKSLICVCIILCLASTLEAQSKCLLSNCASLFDCTKYNLITIYQEKLFAIGELGAFIAQAMLNLKSARSTQGSALTSFIHSLVWEPMEKFITWIPIWILLTIGEGVRIT